MVAGNLELDKLVERFEVHNRFDGKSPRTVQWYNEALDLFLKWLRGEGLSTCVDDLGEDEVRSFILHLQERKGWRGRLPATPSTTGSGRCGLSLTGCFARASPSAAGCRTSRCPR